MILGAYMAIYALRYATETVTMQLRFIHTAVYSRRSKLRCNVVYVSKINFV
jgi:hypothetical protein